MGSNRKPSALMHLLTLVIFAWRPGWFPSIHYAILDAQIGNKHSTTLVSAAMPNFLKG